ncbi:VanW family protein [Paenibacillus thermotolerans]|uniref:VanW family protein n=1 Tax=Paenibacillus thermotolerans TaxID=3027807 RepID=UPI0023684FAF|nr:MULTISPECIES: VanW family protein [unclassified Paenibacillus]
MKYWLVRITLFFLLTVLAAIGTIAFWGMNETLPRGLTVSGWHVGGMTAAEFERSYKQKVSAVIGAKVTLKGAVPGKGDIERAVSLGELGLQMNADAVREQVVSILEGSIWERAVQRWEWHGKNIPLRVSINERLFAAKVKSVWPELYAARPVDAKRVITASDQIQYVPGKSVVRIDTKTLRQTVSLAVGEAAGLPPVPGGALPESLEAPKLLRAEGGLMPEAGGGFGFVMPMYEEEPKVTVESLKAEGIERVIASFSTSFASSAAGRKHNVTSTASVVNDTVLPPGDVFDYAKVIAETEKQYGYREAPVILNGKLVPGIGGGICQVSTTIYNAVLRAGLEIVERRNHSLPIGYVPVGQDATFSNGNINFKWRNSTGKHLLIRTETRGGVLTVKLFGSMPKNVTYEIRSVTLKTIEPPVKYVKNTSLAKGTVSLLQRGKPGYIVETYRYKKVDGKVVSREKISRDTYKAQPYLYASNAGGKDAPSPSGGNNEQIIEDGVMAPVFD